MSEHAALAVSCEPVLKIYQSQDDPAPNSDQRCSEFSESDREFARVSRPGELHPQPLVEPYVTVSRHTAPIARPVALP